MTSYPSSFQERSAFSGGWGVESVRKILGGPLLNLRKPPVPGAEDPTDMLARLKGKVNGNGTCDGRGQLEECEAHARCAGLRRR